MLITIPDLLSKDEVHHFREVLDKSEWEAGSKTAGVQSESVKRNQQMPVGSDAALKLGQYLLQKLSANPVFLSAALPPRESCLRCSTATRPTKLSVCMSTMPFASTT